MSLRAEHVTLKLGDGDREVTALDDVSIEVAPGQLTAVLGPSGAGKSSLLAVCGGLRTPTSGRVVINGTEITGLKRSKLTEIRRDRIGFVFQQSNLVPSLNAVDQLLLLVHLRGSTPSREDRDRAVALLEEVGMSDRQDRRPGELSGGERQRVGIARAFMTDPAVLLVDEPTSMLDHARGQQIVELLVRACHQHNVATVMVTHDHSNTAAADQVVHMIDGRLSSGESENAAD